MCVQGDPNHLRLEDLIEEMVWHGVEYTMVRCGVANPEDSDAGWEGPAHVEDTDLYARTVKDCFEQAKPKYPLRQGLHCQDLLLTTSNANHYVVFE